MYSKLFYWILSKWAVAFCGSAEIPRFIICNLFPYLRTSSRDIHWEVCDHWCIQSVAVLHNWAGMHYWAAFHSYGRFLGGDPFYPWSRVRGSPREENSNWWTLGWKSGKICPYSDPWRDLGDPQTGGRHKWSEQRIFPGIPPLLDSIFGGWKVQEVFGDFYLISFIVMFPCLWHFLVGGFPCKEISSSET